MYSVLILFGFTLVLSLKISYSKYTLQVESNPITINTKAYSELTISNITPVQDEEDTYNVTVSNSNGYDVNFYVIAVNQNDSTESLKVIQYDDENNFTENYTITAGSSKTIKVKLGKNDEIENYTTTENGYDLIIPFSIFVKGSHPYYASSVSNNETYELKAGTTLKTLAESIDSTNYGDKFNYSITVSNITLDNWRVLYNDKNEGRVYIMIDNYIPGKAIHTSETSFWVSNDQITWSVDSNNTTTNDVVSELNDTSIWSYLLTDELKNIGASCIGSPTLPLYVNSWNQTHESKIYIGKSDDGYSIGTSEDNLGLYISTNDFSSLIGNETEKIENLYMPKYTNNYGTYPYPLFLSTMMAGKKDDGWFSNPSICGYFTEFGGFGYTILLSPEPLKYIRPVISIPSSEYVVQNDDESWSLVIK